MLATVLLPPRARFLGETGRNHGRLLAGAACLGPSEGGGVRCERNWSQNEAAGRRYLVTPTAGVLSEEVTVMSAHLSVPSAYGSWAFGLNRVGLF